MKRSRRIRRRSSVLLVGLAASLAVSGCTPAHYREQADKAAYDIIAAGQRQALGREESFTIERASDTLRRRLLSVQNLPVSGPASLGVERLDPPPHWPEPSDRQEALEDVRPDAGTAGAVVVLSLTEALQVAARNRKPPLFRLYEPSAWGPELRLCGWTGPVPPRILAKGGLRFPWCKPRD